MMGSIQASTRIDIPAAVGDANSNRLASEYAAGIWECGRKG